MIFSRRIFFFSLLGILGGVALANCLPGQGQAFGLEFRIFLLVLSIALLCLGFYYRSSKWLYLISALLFGLTLGVWRVSLVPTFDYTLCDAGQVTLSGRVISESTETNFSRRATFAPETWTENILLSVPRENFLDYGDRLEIKGQLKRPANFQTDQGRVFDYVRYLAKDNILCVLEAKQIKKLETGASLLSPFFRLKNGFLSALGRALPEPESTLLGGLVLGGKNGLDQDLKQSYTATGLSHILVLSGYNISLVAAALTGVSLMFGSLLSFLFTSLGLSLFVFVAGGGAAAVRAGIMGVIAVLARSLGRPNSAGLPLLLAAVVMVWLNPRLANFDLGFQLSFLATLGIVYGPAMFKPLVEKILKPGFWSETLVATLGALVFTWPWLAYATGQVSLVALPANLLVVPMVSPLMWFGLLLGAIGMLSSLLALILAWPIYLVLAFQIWLVRCLAKIPLAMFNVDQFSLLWLVIFYGPIIYWATKMNKKRYTKSHADH